MAIIDLLQEYNIEYIEEGHHHCTQGWIQLKECPFCEGTNYQLGFELNHKFFSCWRCGGHSVFKTIKAFFPKTNTEELKKLIEKHISNSIYIPKKEEKRDIPKNIEFPYGTSYLSTKHKQYLKDRKYNPLSLENTWGLKGTNHLGDYKFRIIAPIVINNKIISYQGRDITDKQKLRYKTCSKSNEVVHHKNTLYGWDYRHPTIGVITEGITDVWRLGCGSLATFGAKYTQKQFNLICRTFKKVFILFDNDPAGDFNSNKMKHDLNHFGVYSEVIKLDKDPGSLSNNKAKKLMIDLVNAPGNKFPGILPN